jgi:LCP family protein required for cell wall assembly
MARKGAKSSGSQRTRRRSFFLSGVFLLFVVGGAYSAYLFYSTVKDFVAHAQLGMPSVQTSIDLGRAPDEQLPDVSTERVNILLLGTDKRAGEVGPSRTDTMILATIDPQTKTAAMLSIPRDLWVAIPGYSENRINVAHFLGERDNYPGGGPALAKKTVQYTLGVPVHYYVRINFEGFERIIDAIGGITIDVKEAIHDTKYPDNNYGYMTVDIPAGVQHMDGKTALQYARARHGSSDFDRARRQQEVLKAIRDKVLSLNIPLTRIPEILKLVGDSVQTDLSLNEMYALAKVGRELTGDIQSAVIDENMTTPQTTPDGASVLIPNRTKIRDLVNTLFGGPAPTASPALSEKEQIAQEAAKVDVQNGTLTPGLALRTTEYLKGLGYNVVSYSNADRSDYALTLIVDYSGMSATVNALATLFNVSPENIRQGASLQSDVDVRVILGRDYAAAPAR